METPIYKSEHVAGCALCAIPPPSLNPMLVTYPCWVIWWIGAAV